MMRFFVAFRYKTRPLFRKGKWKAEDKVFIAAYRTEALRLARKYAEENYRGEWVMDVCSEIAPEG